MPQRQQLIINGCVAGDRIAQAKLYQMYAAKMLGVCMWYARNKQEAEEILHDGFMRVFTYIGRFSGRGSLEGWIRKIMVNAALFRYRTKSPHLKPVLELHAGQEPVAESTSVIAQLEAKELVQLVQTLPPACRMVFTLHVLEGMKHREIASLLGVSEGTSKSNLADARALLQKALAQEKRAVSF